HSLGGARGDRPVDGVEVGPGGPLDDVGRDPAAGVEVAVELDADGHLAESVGAPGDGPDVERDQPGIEADRPPDGAAGGVDHAVAEGDLLDHLAAVAHPDRGGGREVGPAGDLDGHEGVDVVGAGDLVGHDGDEVG